MEKTLQLQDLVNFENEFTNMKNAIYKKNASKEPYSEDLLKIFQTSFTTID